MIGRRQIESHIRKLVDSDRRDTGAGHQANRTEKHIFLGERPILALDVRSVAQMK